MKSAMQEGQNISKEFAPSPVPWQVQIGLRQKSFEKVICVGTILDEKTILTAGHCFQGLNFYSSNFFIVAGITNSKDIVKS